MFFEGKKVSQVSLSELIIWNGGHGAVKGDDIAPDDPITFSFGDGVTILKAEIAAGARMANNSSLNIPSTGGRLEYRFAFLDERDGAFIRVLHTGQATATKPNRVDHWASKGVEYVGLGYPVRLRQANVGDDLAFRQSRC